MTVRMSVLSVLCLLMSAPLHGQEEQSDRAGIMKQKFETARARFDAGLRSENDGVVEAVMMLIVKAKLTVPAIDIAGLREAIDDLSTTHPSKTIQYEAYLSSAVLENPQWFSAGELMKEKIPEVYFSKVSQQLQSKLFGANSY